MNNRSHFRKILFASLSLFFFGICSPSSAQTQLSDEDREQIIAALKKELSGDSVKVPPAGNIPFDGMDLTWINGQNRQTDYPLQLKNKKTGETILTGVAYLDAYYSYNFARPVDNTQTISSTMGRTNEFTMNLVSIGIESNYRNVIGRIWLQFGQMGEIIQSLDGTVGKGDNTSVNALRFIREAAVGYHFNKWHGINVEAGIFMSYIGLESYITQENWSYQRSMVCDFTPFYFSGARIQMHPSRKFRTEIWLLNGWQTYNAWNQIPGIGSSNYYRPNENIQLVANFYGGFDTRNSNRFRFHHDNSIVMRYFQKKKANGLSQGAFSINTHYGFQYGNGASPSDQYMTGCSVANRLWFAKNRIALTLRGDIVTNPGLYLAFTPSPVQDNDFNDAMNSDPSKQLTILQGTATIDIMPKDWFTLRLEYGYRHANVPYFAGPGGTTSPDGWIDTPANGWRPDLRRNEQRITVAVNFRL